MLRRKRGNTEADRAKKLERERKKLRKQMIRTRYGQAPVRHSKKGIRACFFSGAAVFLLLLLLASSYTAKGNVGVMMGVVGLVTLAFSVAGLVTGIQGFKERDKNYITCKISTGIGGFMLICMCAIFIRGLF